MSLLPPHPAAVHVIHSLLAPCIEGSFRQGPALFPPCEVSRRRGAGESYNRHSPPRHTRGLILPVLPSMHGGLFRPAPARSQTRNYY